MMVSVILPIYKERIEWVKIAIDSILNQTYRDFELLLINDNPESRENIALISGYEQRDKRVKGILHEENMGLPRSLNLAIKEAKGKYIARMDADDVSMPERFSKQVAFMDAHPEVGVVGAQGITIDENGKFLNKKNMYEKDADLKGATLFYTPFIHPVVMFRRELVLNNLYDENCRVGQDRELWARLKDKTNFYNIPEVLIKYRASSFQMVQKVGEKRYNEILENLSGKIMKYWNIAPKYAGLYAGITLNIPAEISELNEFFLYLMNAIKERPYRYFIIKRYVQLLVKSDKRKVLYNPIVRKYPLEYFSALFNSMKRVRLKH